MTQDDALYCFRVRVLALAKETGNVRSACKAMGIHPSTFYRWRKQVHRFGLEILHPRERPSPRMPNATSPLIVQKVLAFALAHPTVGPQRISDELRRRKWGGFKISPNGVHKVLRRHGLNTKAKRLGLVAGYAAPPEPIEKEAPPERHIDVDRPGELVRGTSAHQDNDPHPISLLREGGVVSDRTVRAPAPGGIELRSRTYGLAIRRFS